MTGEGSHGEIIRYTREAGAAVPGGRGLHARPVLAAWRTARRYRSSVRIVGRGWSIHLSAAPLSGLAFRMGVLQGRAGDRSGRVRVRVSGPDADEVLAAVVGELEQARLAESDLPR